AMIGENQRGAAARVEAVPLAHHPRQLLLLLAHPVEGPACVELHPHRLAGIEQAQVVERARAEDLEADVGERDRLRAARRKLVLSVADVVLREASASAV